MYVDLYLVKKIKQNHFIAFKILVFQQMKPVITLKTKLSALLNPVIYSMTSYATNNYYYLSVLSRWLYRDSTVLSQAVFLTIRLASPQYFRFYWDTLGRNTAFLLPVLHWVQEIYSNKPKTLQLFSKYSFWKSIYSLILRLSEWFNHLNLLNILSCLVSLSCTFLLRHITVTTKVVLTTLYQHWR